MSEFDGETGDSSGKVSLPSHLVLGTYAAARAKEIQVMRKELATSHTTKMQFQKLPKHMRRRAMSHNTKRLPRRLREIHLSQMKKSGLPPKQKRPSRKYRRKPKNLITEYTRRQSRVRWLNTHIWHAKRFHMVEKWGYKLPYCPCDKAFRACYRATSKHCLIQDISYYRCVEVSGKFVTILEGLKKIIDPNTGLTFAAKCFTGGRREGSIALFHAEHECGFRRAIGTVNFIWKPNTESDTDNRVLWIWIHPTFYEETLSAINSCLDLQALVVDLDKTHFLDIYSNSEGVELRELDSELSRFRLTGPLSHSVLTESFQLVKDNFPEWINKKIDILSLQNSFWESLFSTSQLSPHVVIPLVVRDPRFNLPKVRMKALPDVSKYAQFVDCTLDSKSLWSPLWDADTRNQVTKNKLSNAEISTIRSETLVPGDELKRPDSVPILMIQRPGNRDVQTGLIGYGGGWDLIVPTCYAQPFFVSLIMRGARAGGLRETQSIALEMCQLDVLNPDTKAGQQEEDNVGQEYRDKFFRLPPNKRTNYNKFMIASPFNCNWSLLNKEWGGDEQFCILRDKKLLNDIQEFLHSKTTKKLPVCPINCLLPVTISLSKKGLCKKFSIICLPEASDFRKEPIEKKCKDTFESERRKIRRSHKTLLKKLKRRRIAAKRQEKPVTIDKTVLSEYTKKMRQLWLPEAKTVRRSCSRDVIGFVKHGDFSFQIGQSKAVGYVTVACLANLAMLKFRNKVLVRNTNSRQYRLGTINVISG